MNKKNITFKLTLTFITITVFSTLTIGIIAINIFKNSIYNIKTTNMKKHANEVADTLKESLEPDFQSTKFQETIKIVNKILGEQLWIIDKNNKVLTISNDRKNVISIDNPQILSSYNDIFRSTFSGKYISQEMYSEYYDDYMMTVGIPLKNADDVIVGTIILSSSMADISNLMDRFFIYLISAVLIEIIIISFLSYYFSLKITKPIKQINKSALEMADGNYGIVSNIYQKDEIGELANSFDLLSLRLQYSMNKLSQERNKLSYIINSTDEGILALDRNNKLLNINDASLKILGIDNGDSSSNIINLLGDLNIMGDIKEVIITRKIKTTVRKLNDRFLNFSICPIVNERKELIGTVVVILDITEKENLEQMRKDFIANVSHEFRTPLTVIKGNLESIIDGMIPENQVIDNIRNLLKETDRLQKMVQNLLDLSRLEADKVSLELAEQEINSIIKDTVRTLRPLTNAKKININLSLEEEIPPILTDYDKMKQLFIIFMDNAIKFSNENSTIYVSTKLSNGKLEISIKDNGTGIEENQLIFLGERFYKADKSRRYSSKGMGLGLSIAKNLCKLLKGDFFIESEIDKGTTIRISFPIKNNCKEE